MFLSSDKTNITFAEALDCPDNDKEDCTSDANCCKSCCTGNNITTESCGCTFQEACQDATCALGNVSRLSFNESIKGIHIFNWFGGQVGEIITIIMWILIIGTVVVISWKFGWPLVRKVFYKS
jgi:hypothetical protein